MCGQHDDDDFKAKDMCCTCGGGRFGNEIIQFSINVKFCKNHKTRTLSDNDF